MPYHLRGSQGRLEMAAVDGADRRSAKNADAPMDQSREAHLAAWLLHSPEGIIPKVYRPEFRCSGCHRLIHPKMLALLDGP
jgi:hypothetical protein